MPAAQYTLQEAATHELGHAVIACALRIPFRFVELSPGPPPMTGWGGQCLLLTPPGRRVDLDAFQLGGPIVQMQVVPQSLGANLNDFSPSLFANAARCLDHADLFPVANNLGWGTDLYLTGLMHQAAANVPMFGFGGAKPWVPNLEQEVSGFLAQPQVLTFFTTTRTKLMNRGRLLQNEVTAHYFAAGIDHLADQLRLFCAQQPP